MFINKQRFYFDFLHFFIDCLALDDCNLILGWRCFPDLVLLPVLYSIILYS